MLLSLWSTYWRGPQSQGVSLTGVVTEEAAGPSVTVSLSGGGSQVIQLTALGPLQSVSAIALQAGAVALGLSGHSSRSEPASPAASAGPVSLTFTAVVPQGFTPSPALATGSVTLALSGVLSAEAPGAFAVSLTGGGLQALDLIGVAPNDRTPSPSLSTEPVIAQLTGLQRSGVEPPVTVAPGGITAQLPGVPRTGREGAPSVALGVTRLDLVGVLPRAAATTPGVITGSVTVSLVGSGRSGEVGHGPTVEQSTSVSSEYIVISVTVTVAPTDVDAVAASASGAAEATLTAAAETLATWVAALTLSNTTLAQATVHSEGLQMADEIVRGNSVTIKATFRDALGAVVTPQAAAVFISFLSSAGQRSTVELPLVDNAGEWSATWDSSNARVGEVFWSAQTKNTTPSAAVDGSFMLVANMANPENLA